MSKYIEFNGKIYCMNNVKQAYAYGTAIWIEYFGKEEPIITHFNKNATAEECFQKISNFLLTND